MESKIERFEIKYILNSEQLVHIKDEVKKRMVADKYGATTIFSLYLDTVNHYFIRSSIEKPPFKEKIRFRRYLNNNDGSAFLEIKRKLDGYVYKRRLKISYNDLHSLFEDHNVEMFENKQIAKEILFLDKNYGKVKPWIAILYEREAFVDSSDKYFRITFDLNPRFRLDKLDSSNSNEGELILPSGWAVMEIKTQDAIPLWLTHLLSNYNIYPTSFSKVGSAYKKILERNNIYELTV